MTEFEHAVLAELRAIRIAISQRELSVTVKKSTDGAILAKLLPAIAGVFGSSSFKVSEALAYPAIRELTGHQSPDKLGALFARNAGRPIDELVLERSKRERGSTLWLIQRTISPPSHPTV
jgi:hypothetical protein